MSRKEYIGLPGTFREKIKGMKQPGLDFSRLVRDELRANGYPTKECTDVCNQPNICDLLTDCNLGGSTTTTVALGLTGQDLTVTVNGVADTITLPSGGGSITLDPATNPALTLLAGVLKLDLTAAGSYSNTTSGLASTSIQGVIDELDGIVDNILLDIASINADIVNLNNSVNDILAYTYTNGLTKTGGDIELGGTLEHNTVIDTTTPYTFEVVKDNVKLLASPGGFGGFGTGESISFRGAGPNTTAASGLYSNPIGNTSWGTSVVDSSTSVAMRGNFNLTLQAIRFDTSVAPYDILSNLFIGVDKLALSKFDQTTNTDTGYTIENFIAPVTGVALFLRGLPIYPDNATASANLPVEALYKDVNGFVRIVI